MTLDFIPRKLVPEYMMKGWHIVAGCQGPKEWAVLMEKRPGKVDELPQPSKPKLHERFSSNKSRSRSAVNTARYERQRQQAAVEAV